MMRTTTTALAFAGALLAGPGCASREGSTGGGEAGTTPAAAPAPELRRATFDARHELNVRPPEGARQVRVWFAMPQEVPEQTVGRMHLVSTGSWSMRAAPATDGEGNRFLYFEASNPTEPLKVVAEFQVVRSEQRASVDPSLARPLTGAEREKMAHFLEANKNVVINDEIRSLSARIVGDERNPVVAARKIYDWVLGDIDYWVKDPAHKKASPVGSTEYCLANKTGNCTDFHSLWTSLARASGIPTRMVYGSFFKKDLDGKDADQSYHCWPEFYASGIGWIPHDVAVADIFVGDFALDAENEPKVKLTTADGYSGADPAKVEYYFGAIDERRVTWSVGRDLVMDPKPAAGAINALPKAYVEVDGKPLAESKEGPGWTSKLTFREVR